MKTIVAAAVAALALVSLAGCGTGTGTISKADLDSKISDALTKSVGQRPDKIECPKDIKAKVGSTARCVLTAGGQKIGLTAKVDRMDGDKYHLAIQVDQKPTGQ